MILEALEDRTLLTAWTPIGPAPITNGQVAGSLPVSGRVTGIATDPSDANTVYIASAGGGIWKSINATTASPTWTPLTDNVTDGSGNPVPEFMGAVAETDATAGAHSGQQIVYAGTGEANNSGDSFYGEGILVSTDGGATWTLTNAGGAFNGETVSKIAIDPSDTTGATAYAAVSGFGVNGKDGNTGIWKTTNFGQTWTNTTGSAGLSKLDAWSDVVIDPNTPTTLYAAQGSYFGGVGGQSNNGVYKSINGGNTWQLLASAPNGNQDGRISLALYDDGTTNELFVSIAQPTSNPSSGQLFKMLKSTNGGTSFTDLTTNVLATSNYLGDQGWYDTTLAINPTNANYIYAAGDMSQQGPTFSGSPLESFDGGTTWHDIGTDPAGKGPHTDAHAVAFDANGNLLDGDDGGVFKLSNPTSLANQRWSSLNTNLQITQFTGIAVDPTTGNVYGGSQDNGTETTTGSLGWNRILAGDGGITRVDPTNPSIVYAEQADGSLFVSTNGGASFNFIGGNLLGTKVNFYGPYVLDSSGNLYYGTDALDFSSNHGASFSEIGKPGVNGFNPTDAAIDAIAVSPFFGGTIVYVSAGGHMFVTQNAHVANPTWTQIDLPGGVRAGALNSLVVDPSDPIQGTAYAIVNSFQSGGKHVFKTTNFGTTWTDISGNLPNTPVWSVAVSPDGKTVYVGTDIGVYSTSNVNGSSTNWSPFGTGLPNAQVVELDLVPSLNLLAAGTHGRGAWEIAANPTFLTITTDPSNQTVIASQTATFTAAANGNPAPTVQWQVSSDGVTFSDIGGATSTTLTLSNVQASQNGDQYRAVFTNSSGSAATTAATLMVTPANVTTTAADTSIIFSPSSQTVMLNATLGNTSIPSNAVDEGTVTFTIKSGGTTVGSVPGNVSGGKANATFNVPAGQAAGSYTIVVTYSDSQGNFTDNADNNATLTIEAANVTTTADNASAVFSSTAQTVKLNATLADTSIVGDTVGEGTVTFTVKNGSTIIGTPVPGNVSGGKANATFNVPAGLTAGSYTVAVTYSDSLGNFTDNGDTDSTLTITSANITATADDASAIFSSNVQSVTLNASVADTSIASDTVGEGTVTFTVKNGSTIIGTPVPGNVSGGKANATFNLPAGLAAGSYTIAVSYSDSTGNFGDNGDTNATLTIAPANVATTASNASAVFSSNVQTVTLNATLADTSKPGETVDEGSVTFTVKDGSTVIGTPVPGNVSGGKASATFNLPAGLTAGSYTIAVSYNDGTGNFGDNGDTNATLTIAPANVATTASNASAVFSSNVQTVTLNATLADTSIAGDTVGEGTVTFTVKNGSTNIGTAVPGTVSAGKASAAFNVPAGLTAGNYTIAVSYTDSQGNFTDNADNDATLTLTSAAVTAAAVDASAVYSPNAQTVTLNANVTDTSIPGDTVNAGSVTFTVKDGTTTLGSVPGNVSGGKASADFSLPAGQVAGSYTIAVSYADSQGNFTDNSRNATLTITPANVTTTASNVSAVFSPNAQTVTLNATLADISIASDTVGEGTVTFTLKNGSTIIGTPVQGNVSGGKANATFNLPAGLTVGSYTLEVAYTDGQGNFTDATDNNATFTVASANVATKASNASAIFGSNVQTVTLNATLADISIAGDTVGEGTVTFTVKNGSTIIGTPVPGTVTGGKATTTFNLPAGLTAGNYTIIVRYSDSQGRFTDNGDTNATLTIAPANVTTTASTTAATFNTTAQTLSLHAAVVDASNANPSIDEGNITFTIRNGSSVVGSVQSTVNGGVANATFTLPAEFAAGSYILAVHYSDSQGNFTDTADSNAVLLLNPAVSNAVLTQVALTPNLTGLTATETLTAHISSSTAVTQGTVIFVLSNLTVSAPVDANGNAVASVTLPMLALLAPQGISVHYFDPANDLTISSNSQTAAWQSFNAMLPSTAAFRDDGGDVSTNLFLLMLTFSYNSLGLLTEVDMGLLHLVFTYNADNVLTEVTLDGVPLLPGT